MKNVNNLSYFIGMPKMVQRATSHTGRKAVRGGSGVAASHDDIGAAVFQNCQTVMFIFPTIALSPWAKLTFLCVI